MHYLLISLEKYILYKTFVLRHIGKHQQRIPKKCLWYGVNVSKECNALQCSSAFEHCILESLLKVALKEFVGKSQLESIAKIPQTLGYLTLKPIFTKFHIFQESRGQISSKILTILVLGYSELVNNRIL